WRYFLGSTPKGLTLRASAEDGGSESSRRGHRPVFYARSPSSGRPSTDSHIGPRAAGRRRWCAGRSRTGVSLGGVGYRYLSSGCRPLTVAAGTGPPGAHGSPARRPRTGTSLVPCPSRGRRGSHGTIGGATVLGYLGLREYLKPSEAGLVDLR